MTTSHEPLAMWGGVECTVNRVGDRWFDQLAWSGHDRRLDDLDRFAALGIRVLRYPLLWERLAPDDVDRIDWTWADLRMARLRELGIRPIVGLVHHGSGPAYTSLTDGQFAPLLARFAGAVARRYPWVTDFTPVNEPLTTARFSGLYGHWYPHGRNDVLFVSALLNQLRGVVMAMQAIRAVTPNARLVQTEDCGRTFGTAPTRAQIEHECDRRWLTFDLLTGHVDARHPLRAFLRQAGMSDEDERFFLEAQCAPDVVGVNYYLTSDRYLDHRLDRYAASTHGGNGYVTYADVEAVRARTEGIAGHDAHLIDAWQRYRLPLAVTEAHLGCTREEQVRWLLEAWRGAEAARRSGADVRAVTAWALLGSFNWSSLVTRDDGQYEPGAFDVRGGVPRSTAIAGVISSLARGQTPQHPALDGTGWWRRSNRLFDAPPRSEHRFTRDRPILIVGRTGTLAHAFHRVCELRDLASYIVGRPHLDVTDPSSIDAVIRQARPWAVVNASGYVRVDQAECDESDCHAINVTGAVNLAAACRRHVLPMITFSSDLVFDGCQRRPYLEDDEPRPLNAYGRSKAEAERRVCELLADALVVRTSAFFGPWDRYNFLVAAFDSIDGGEPFAAATDVVVSPTYVPDLVNAALDLLIDGERGVCHLTNDGVVSWFEFACAAAQRSGRSTEWIVPAAGASTCGPAVRPAFSALASRRGRLLRPLDQAIDAFVSDTLVATRTDACASR